MNPTITDLNDVAAFAKDILTFFGNSFQYQEVGPQVADSALSVKQNYKRREVDKFLDFVVSVDEWKWYVKLEIKNGFEKVISFKSEDIDEVKKKIDKEIFRKMPIEHKAYTNIKESIDRVLDEGN